MIDFSTTPEQRALAEAGSALLQGATDRGGPDAGDATWTALAEFGALGLLTESGGGSLSDLVALFGALGAGLCPDRSWPAPRPVPCWTATRQPCSPTDVCG